jgi:hypothetical protein
MTRKKQPRKKALKAGQAFYFGKRCKHHPNMNGLRVVECYNCVACNFIFRLRHIADMTAPAESLV